MKTVIQRFVAWLLSTFFERLRQEVFDITELHTRSQRIVFEENIREILRVKRVPVYVTLRGTMALPDGAKVSHGWTRVAWPLEDQTITVPFHPMMPFECERVDVLGPAVIEGVAIGNYRVTQSPFEAPASVDLIGRCEVGSVVRVELKGTP